MLKGTDTLSGEKIPLKLFVSLLTIGQPEKDPASILLKSISDRYRLDKIPVEPITVQYRFSRMIAREGQSTMSTVEDTMYLTPDAIHKHTPDHPRL